MLYALTRESPPIPPSRIVAAAQARGVVPDRYYTTALVQSFAKCARCFPSLNIIVPVH